MISDFFGVEPDGRLSVKGRIKLSSGETLLLRPLSLEKLFSVMRLGLPSFSMEQIAAMEPEQFMSEFAETLVPILTLALDVDASTIPAEDVPGVILWYVNEHDWKRIYSEILSPDGEPQSESETSDAVLDLMFAIEIATEGARPIECQLGMRPESWLSTLGAMERRADRLRKGTESKPAKGQINAKRLSMDQMFSMLPGGETINVPVEPGDGGH